jgi:hypothetical protein
LSEKFGTNGNFGYFSYFYLQIKDKRLKMALTLDEMVEIVLLSGRQGWTQRQSLMPDILKGIQQHTAQ